ncbi:tigger transposable element-derived protein 1 [Trichonephila clavipes]|nr:tigger transposable element-derived protein 1 [Trichonephila clavipes]
MLKPLLINKSFRPCALKGKDLKQLPVHWMANQKAWMTTAIFTEWFNNCFVPEVEAYMKEKSLDFKVLLIVDNAASHPQLEHPNVQLIWPACVTDNATTQTSTLLDEIINLAHEIGGDGFNTFSHDDIDELFVDDALSDNDIIDLTLDLTVDGVVGLEEDNDEEEKSTTLTGKLIQEGLQLCSKIIFLLMTPILNEPLNYNENLHLCMFREKEALCLVITLPPELKTPRPHLNPEYTDIFWLELSEMGKIRREPSTNRLDHVRMKLLA